MTIENLNIKNLKALLAGVKNPLNKDGYFTLLGKVFTNSNPKRVEESKKILKLAIKCKRISNLNYILQVYRTFASGDRSKKTCLEYNKYFKQISLIQYFYKTLNQS